MEFNDRRPSSAKKPSSSQAKKQALQSMSSRELAQVAASSSQPKHMKDEAGRLLNKKRASRLDAERAF